MKIKIKQFDKSLPLPAYKTLGAACFDLYSREEVTISPGEVGYIPLNVAIEVPKGHWVMLVSSGSTHKMGIMMANSIGIGDEDFCGDNDEYKFPAFNFTKKNVTIEKGTRVAQAMIVKFDRAEFELVDHLDNADRGSFGTTGKK